MMPSKASSPSAVSLHQMKPQRSSKFAPERLGGRRKLFPFNAISLGLNCYPKLNLRTERELKTS